MDRRGRRRSRLPVGGRWPGERTGWAHEHGVSAAQRTRGPVQQSPLTCGSACLTVARMLVNPDFARWIVSGEGSPGDAPGEPRSPSGSPPTSASSKRTNGLYAGGHRLNLPWPRRLGTPPWAPRRSWSSAPLGAPPPTRSGCCARPGPRAGVAFIASSRWSATVSRRCCTSAMPSCRATSSSCPGRRRRPAGRLRPGHRTGQPARRGQLRRTPAEALGVGCPVDRGPAGRPAPHSGLRLRHRDEARRRGPRGSRPRRSRGCR